VREVDNTTTATCSNADVDAKHLQTHSIHYLRWACFSPNN